MRIHDDVLQGSEGHLFLVGGRHEVISLFTGERTPTPASVATYYANLRERAAYCSARDIRFLATIFPEKLYAMGHHAGIGAVRSLFRDVYAASEHDDGSLPHRYPDSELRACDGYFRTDTHLNLAGLRAILACVLADEFGERVAEYDARIDGRVQDDRPYVGDLGRKFEPPFEERIQRVRPPEGWSAHANGVKAGNDGLMIIGSNDDAISARTLLIFGDSFFRQLLPHLGGFYRRIVFCRTRYFHAELVDAVRPDTILTGMAERYLSQCSPDSDRPHFLAYPSLKGKPTEPDPGFAEAFATAIDQKALLR